MKPLEWKSELPWESNHIVYAGPNEWDFVKNFEKWEINFEKWDGIKCKRHFNLLRRNKEVSYGMSDRIEQRDDSYKHMSEKVENMVRSSKKITMIMIGVKGLSKTAFFGINGKIKEQFNNENVVEPNKSQPSHDTVIGTIVWNKNWVTTDISVEDTLLKIIRTPRKMFQFEEATEQDRL